MQNEINTFSVETIIASISALAAIGSAIYAWRATVVSKEALRLSKLDFDERHGDIRPYLTDSMTWLSQEGDKYYSAACLFTNTANAPVTISSLGLILHSYGNATKIKIDPIQVKIELPINLPQLNSSINLSARESISGWLTFRIPKHVVNTKRIDRYEISGIDSLDKKISIDAFIVKQIEIL